MDSLLHTSASENENSVEMILQSLDLEKYQPLFLKTGLSLTKFMNLTGGDLDFLGIKDLNDKRKILDFSRYFKDVNKDDVEFDDQKVIGNTVYQLYMISTRLTNLRRKLNTHPRPRNTLVEPSVSATTVMMDFIKVINDQLEYTKSDLISALPSKKMPARVYYIRRAVAVGVLTLIVYGLFRKK